jgi:hypothetical protein
MIPAMIDSQGNPGIAGKVSGVEIEIAVEVLVVVGVGVLTTVIVETDVLTTVVTGELVDVIDSVKAEDVEVEVLSCETVEVVLEVLSVVFCVVVACSPTTGRLTGSRWKTPVKLPAIGAPLLVGCTPTAQPSVGFVVKTENKPRPAATGPGIGQLVHVEPSHHAVIAFPVAQVVVPDASEQPTAQPSPLPELVPYVSTWTLLHTVAAGALDALPTAQRPPLLFVVMMVLPDPTIQPWF